MDEDKLRELFSEIVKLLITYEIELTAYSLVLKTAQDRIIQAGIPWDMGSNLRKLGSSLALRTEAEAEYAQFFGLLQKVTPQTLESALACIKELIASQIFSPIICPVTASLSSIVPP